MKFCPRGIVLRAAAIRPAYTAARIVARELSCGIFPACAIPPCKVPVLPLTDEAIMIGAIWVSRSGEYLTCAAPQLEQKGEPSSTEESHCGQKCSTSSIIASADDPTAATTYAGSTKNNPPDLRLTRGPAVACC